MRRNQVSLRRAAWGLGLVLLGLLIYKSLGGARSSGTTASMAQLPFVGKHLDSFRVTGPIRYVCVCSYTRPVKSIMFTATTTKENLESFFGRRLERPYPGIESKWRGKLQSMGVKAEDFPIGLSEEDLSGYRELSTDTRVLVVEVTYRERDRRFTAYVMEAPAELP